MRVARKLAVVPELDEELQRLYGLPLDEFTAARNELATRLRKAGQEEAAERVRAIRKPSVATWLVNQLARRHADEVHELLAAGEQLRKAQEAAFRGGDPGAVREATAAERASVRKLTRLAEQIGEDEGRSATKATLERVNKTLRAASVEPDAAPLLAAGRLPDEVESGGFEALAEIAPPPSAGKRTATAKRDTGRARAAEVKRLKERLEKLERRAADLAERADRAEATAAEARERAEEARAEADAAARELRDTSR
jgi:hypothetical protein